MVKGLGIFVACVAAVCGCAESKPAPRDTTPPPILLITIDTLRADRIGRGITPAIDALAREGITFTNARATAPLTLPSHASILTGALPPEHGARQNGVSLGTGRATLARVLRDRGYQTAAFVGAYVLDRRFGLADGFDHYDDRIPRGPQQSTRLESERRGDQVAAAVRSWLPSADPARPVFLWAHLYDPHAPYAPPAEFLARAGGDAYNGEVAFADAQVASLLEAARARLGPRLLVVVAGDHGEGLGEHGENTHGMLAYDSTLRVPLIFAGAPAAGPRRIDTPASLRDLAPTLLVLAGVKVPSGMTGVDLLADSRKSEVYAETIYPETAGWSALRVLVDHPWKLVVSSTRELYDVSRDPNERRDIAAQHASVAAAMASRADALFRSATPSGAAPSISSEAAERLRALGYVSTGPAPATEAAHAANPRDVITAWNRFEQALSLLPAGRAADALPILRELASSFPDSRVFHSTYASALKDTGRARDALAVYSRLVSRWPGEPSLFHDLAVAARAAGNHREAMRAEQAALALDPRDPNARNGLGLLYSDANRHADAAAAFEQAAALDPNNASFWTNLGNARRALGDLARAEHAYERATRIDASYADAWNGLGVLRVQQGRAADAVALFERAVRADPALFEAQLNLGIALQESGEKGRAAAQYRKVIENAPPHAQEKRAAQELLAALKR